jgi:hypothetical protein
MGFLPIILSLLGFSFLWGMVNYNSIKNKKQEVREAAEDLFKYAQLRNLILSTLSEIHTDNADLKQSIQLACEQRNDAKVDEISPEEKISAEQKVSALIRKIPSAEMNDNYQGSYEQLMTVSQSCLKVAAVYNKKVQEYNELITRYPSRLLASAYGFKPIA